MSATKYPNAKYPNAKNLGQVSIPALNQYLRSAIEQDINIDQLLKEFGISQDLLNDSSQQISGEKFLPLLSSILNLTQDELFGLHTAQFVEPSSYSVLGLISMNCQTLGEAISKIPSFEKLVGDMGVTSFEQEGNNFKISWLCLYSDPLISRHMIDNCLASWLKFAHYLANKNTAPLKVYFTRPPPTKQQKSEYEKLFNCPVYFKRQTNSLFFEKRLLDYPLIRANKQLLSTLESHAKEQLSALSSDKNIVVETENMIRQALTSGNFHQNDIANRLNISAKTLQRKLKAESTQFRVLLEKIRYQQCVEYLNNRSLNLSEISGLLGFSEPRSFYRWFSKLTQLTPGQYRKNRLNTAG